MITSDMLQSTCTTSISTGLQMVLTLVLLIHSCKHSFCTFPKTSYLLIFQDLIYSKSALTFQLLCILNIYYVICSKNNNTLIAMGFEKKDSCMHSEWHKVCSPHQLQLKDWVTNMEELSGSNYILMLLGLTNQIF